MGRSFVSVRQGVKGVADRWVRVSRALRERDRRYGEKLAENAKQHSSEAFVGCDEPLEAAIFSALIEIFKNQDPVEQPTENYVDR
jgi:hypothetical protein